MTIGNAINKSRRDANLFQEQFATLFDVSQQSVQKWENGVSVPDLSKIIKDPPHNCAQTIHIIPATQISRKSAIQAHYLHTK